MDRDDIERQLQDYFASERAEVRAPADLWANVSARLGPQEPAPWWRKLFAGASLQGAGRVYAGAAAALAVAVVGAVMYGAIIGFDGSGGPGVTQEESMASDSSRTTAAASSMAAAPAQRSTPSPALAPESVAKAPAAAMADSATMADSVPRAPSGMTQNASAGKAPAEEPPFRLEVWGFAGSVRSHLFWVALPEGWRSGAPSHMDGTWMGMIAGPDMTLHFTFGVREQTNMLLASTRSEASAQQQRMWDEYVIGNLALFSAPPEGMAGDLRMTLQLPTGTLRVTSERLTPEQQQRALEVFRSIIA